MAGYCLQPNRSGAFIIDLNVSIALSFITICNSVYLFKGEHWTLRYEKHARLCFCAAICDFASCQFATSIRLLGAHTWHIETAKFLL